MSDDSSNEGKKSLMDRIRNIPTEVKTVIGAAPFIGALSGAFGSVPEYDNEKPRQDPTTEVSEAEAIGEHKAALKHELEARGMTDKEVEVATMGRGDASIEHSIAAAAQGLNEDISSQVNTELVNIVANSLEDAARGDAHHDYIGQETTTYEKNSITKGEEPDVCTSPGFAETVKIERAEAVAKGGPAR